MHERVNTGCKHIAPSEQPLQFQSGYFLNKPRILHDILFIYPICLSPWPRGLNVGLRPLASWECAFESRRMHGCLSIVSVVCCQVKDSATS